MDKHNEWNLLLAEEMEYDEMLDELTDDTVFARFIDEVPVEEWEDIPY